MARTSFWPITMWKDINPATIGAKLAEGDCISKSINEQPGLHALVFDAPCTNWINRIPTFPAIERADASRSISDPNQALTLLKELPEHLRELATFGLATRLRAANITGLLWDQVDIARRLAASMHPDQAKARKAIAVPLNDMAMGVLGRRAGISEYVFKLPGEQMESRCARRRGTACARAGSRIFVSTICGIPGRAGISSGRHRVRVAGIGRLGDRRWCADTRIAIVSQFWGPNSEISGTVPRTRLWMLCDTNH